MDDAVWIAEKSAANAKLEWQEARVVMAELELKPALLTFKAWLWATATISSRTMHVPWDDAGCLCPVGDFFNYAAPGIEPCNSDGHQLQIEELLDTNAQRLTDAGFEENISAYCFYARRNYRKKEQVLLSYGLYTNLELLEHYGFLLSNNPNDKVFIPLEPNMYSLCSWPKELLYISQDGKPSFSLLSVLRLWVTPTYKRRSVGHLAYSGKHLSSENEITVMEWISKKCEDILEKLQTSAEQDKLLISIIDKIEDSVLPLELLAKLPSTSRQEFRTFCESHNINVFEDCSDSSLSRKAARSAYRWKLAVQWRFNFKRKLLDCIAHCTQIIDGLIEL